MDDKNKGIYEKYMVIRTDGRSELGEKHFACRYFVLDLEHDPHAKQAVLAYAESCKKEYPALSSDLLAISNGMPDTDSGA